MTLESTPSQIPATPSCVYFKDLRPFLPQELTGYRQVRDEGSTGKYGEVSVSEAERVFQGPGGNEVAVRIVDTSIAPKLGQAITAAAEQAKQRSDEHAESGAPIVSEHAVGFVRFDEQVSEAEANLLVAQRFVVAVTTRGFTDTRELRRVANELNLAGLAKLR